jgi:uncharacterized protein (DUF302 family)
MHNLSDAAGARDTPAKGTRSLMMRIVQIALACTVLFAGTLVLATATPLHLQQERKTDMVEPIPGLVKVASPHSAAKTVERFEVTLKEKGIQLFARIDHADGAAKVKLALRPTTLLIFGNPQVGTPLMQSQQTIGIDLPLRVLVWEDEKGKTWLAYNDPVYLAKRHAITGRDESLKGLTAAFAALANAATAP